MMAAATILPQRGRGTMRSMVEGYAVSSTADAGLYPSTSFAGPPPRAGEDQE